MAARFGTRLLSTTDKYKVDAARNNFFRKKMLMLVGSKVLNHCYYTAVGAYYACFITRRPEENDFFIVRLYAALILF